MNLELFFMNQMGCDTFKSINSNSKKVCQMSPNLITLVVVVVGVVEWHSLRVLMQIDK